MCWGACGMVVQGRDHRRGRGGQPHPLFIRLRKSKKYKAHLLMGSLTQPTTVPQPRDRQPPATPLPTPLSPSSPSNLYKHVQNLLNNGRWENHACFFFYAFFLFPFFKQKLGDHLKCCGALRTSLLSLTPHSIYPFKPLSVSLQHDLSFAASPRIPKLVSEVPLTVSYRCGASVGGVAVTARVFQVLLDAVVDLKEVVVSLRGVIGGCRGARLALGQRVHGQLGGGQRPEGLQAHR